MAELSRPTVTTIAIQTRLSQCEKKLADLLFDFFVVNTTDNGCDQQVPSVALRLQQLTRLSARRRLCLVYNRCGLTPNRTGGRINICTYFVFETPNISPGKRLGKI